MPRQGQKQFMKRARERFAFQSSRQATKDQRQINVQESKHRELATPRDDGNRCGGGDEEAAKLIRFAEMSWDLSVPELRTGSGENVRTE
jgi:hypothetical protein